MSTETVEQEMNRAIPQTFKNWKVDAKIQYFERMFSRSELLGWLISKTELEPEHIASEERITMEGLASLVYTFTQLDGYPNPAKLEDHITLVEHKFPKDEFRSWSKPKLLDWLEFTFRRRDLISILTAYWHLSYPESGGAGRLKMEHLAKIAVTLGEIQSEQDSYAIE